MSAITLEQARTQLAGLLQAQAAGMLSFSYAGRTVSYASMRELSDAVSYWARLVTDLERVAAGESRHGFSVANLGSTR